MRLEDGDSVQDHVKQMTEIFNALSVMDAPVSEEDRVIYLLASLPESFGVLVTSGGQCNSSRNGCCNGKTLARGKEAQGELSSPCASFDFLPSRKKITMRRHW